MQRKHGYASMVLALALFLPPLLNLATELRRLRGGGQGPPPMDFGYGAPPTELPARGTYITGRIIDLRSPSAFRTTYLVHYPRSKTVRPGTVVISRNSIVAGVVAKSWPRAGIALVKSLEDPAFRVSVACHGAELVLSGSGEGRGLAAVSGDLALFADGERITTSGRKSIFPAGLAVGHWRKGQVVPAFSRTDTRWVYLWRDPDLEVLEAAFGRDFLP